MSKNTTRILLVEDDLAMQRSFARILRGAGYMVTTQSNGLEAAQLLERESFDLVMSDIQMPELDGLSLLRRVRMTHPELPVILTTADEDVRKAAQAIEYGANRYLVKPFAPEDLCGAVAAALEGVGHPRQASERELLGAHFREALASLRMAYQPIVSMSRREVFAYEALARPSSAALPHPGALFDAATRLGRVHELSRVIRELVASHFTAAPTQVFVNLHPFDLLDEELYSPSGPLTRFAPRVVLEITERTSLDDIGGVEERIAALRALGYRVAVDDLGAGYSGLSSIARLEPEVVKLDMMLVREVHRHPTKQHLIRAMLQLFGQLGRQVIAEGVETMDEAQVLLGLGVDLIQGYLIAKPSFEFVTPKVAFAA